MTLTLAPRKIERDEEAPDPALRSNVTMPSGEPMQTRMIEERPMFASTAITEGADETGSVGETVHLKLGRVEARKKTLRSRHARLNTEIMVEH